MPGVYWSSGDVFETQGLNLLGLELGSKVSISNSCPPDVHVAIILDFHCFLLILNLHCLFKLNVFQQHTHFLSTLLHMCG